MDKDTVDAKIDETEGVSTEGKSSHPNLDQDNFSQDRDNLIDTVEFDDDEVGGMDLATGGARQPEKTEKVDEKAGATEDGEDKTDKVDKPETDKTDKVDDTKTETVDDKKTDDTKPDRYDKDPAWQRIIKERDAALKENAALKAKQTPEEETKDFIDLSTKTEEEIAEWMNDDPVGYAENLKKIIAYEVKQEMKTEYQERETQSKVDKTFESYSSKHPDNDDKTGFVQMWESGKIQDFMDSNPGHNAISAHIMLTEDSRNKSIEERISKGIEEGVAKVREKLEKENKARVRTDGLDAGPSYTPGDADDELKDTKKKGGLISVLAARSERRKAQAG